MKKIIFTMLVLASGFQLMAQQDAMFTHYMFNTIAVNPAYAGTRDALSLTALHRSQWVGFEGAPQTQTLSLNTPIKFRNTSVGFSAVNDKIGVTNMFSVYGDFSYRIQLNETSKLAFGFKAGFDKLKDDVTSLERVDALDQTFAQNYESRLMPNFGFGMYYFTQKFYLGASIPRLLSQEYSDDGNKSDDEGSRKHFFGIAGTVLKINDDLLFKPTTLVKYTRGAPIEADITAMLIYDNKVWGAAMLRTGDAVGVLLGMYITPQLGIGYSYDWSYANFRSNNGSHEIMLTYDFIYNNEKKIVSPRYF